MFTVNGFVKLALVQLFGCFRLMAQAERDEEIYPRNPSKRDFIRRGQTIHMNKILFATAIVLVDFGEDVSKVWDILAPANNYLEHFIYRRIPLFKDLDEAGNKMGALIATILRNHYKFDANEISRFPTEVSVHLGGQALGLTEKVKPEELEYKPISKRKRPTITREEIYKFLEEIKELEEFRKKERKKWKDKWENKGNDDEEKKKDKNAIFRQLKKALVEDPKLKKDTITKQIDDIEKSKEDIAAVTKTIEDFNKKLKELKALIGE